MQVAADSVCGAVCVLSAHSVSCVGCVVAHPVGDCRYAGVQLENPVAGGLQPAFDFCMLFVFVGNLRQIPAVQEAVSWLLNGREVIASVLVSQVISNVPAAVMLSSFTEKGRALLLGTNIGGLGTLIASLASLISFRLYSRMPGAKGGKYLLQFTLYNVGFLAVLLVFCWLTGGLS